MPISSHAGFISRTPEVEVVSEAERKMVAPWKIMIIILNPRLICRDGDLKLKRSEPYFNDARQGMTCSEIAVVYIVK